MHTLQLKMICSSIVKESELPKESKFQLLSFIKEASDSQIKVLIMDGKIISITDDITEEVIKDRFETYMVSEAGVILSTILAKTPIFKFFWNKWRTLASQYSDAHKLCGTYKISNDRDACIAKARVNFAIKKIELLNQVLGSCSTTKKPENCKKKIEEYIEKEKKKIVKYRQKLDKLVKKGRGYTGEPGDIVATRT